jgi:hypothetical protein
VGKVIKETKVKGVIKEIKEKLDHPVIKEKEVIKVKKECLEVLEAQESQVKKD